MPSTRLGAFTVHYHNEEEYHRVKREIFADQIYYVDSDEPAPVIIDAGAHIGLATLYFKKLFPAARITAIEPNPTSFQLLEQNIWENELADVECVHAALVADGRQTATLNQDAARQWLMTTSTSPGAWNGNQQTQPLTVPARRLADFITQPVNLLKMDIEGAEFGVLRDTAQHLHLIKQLILECHVTKMGQLASLEKLLEPTFGTITISKRSKPIEDPAHFLGLCLLSAHQ